MLFRSFLISTGGDLIPLLINKEKMKFQGIDSVDLPVEVTVAAEGKIDIMMVIQSDSGHRTGDG